MESTVAIVTLGGKQHLVSQGTQIVVNKLTAKEGEVLNLPDLLGGQVVQAKVLSHQLGKKVNGLKFKAKTRYFKRYGHRQSQTSVEIVSIGNTAEKPASKATKPATKKTAPTAISSGKKTALPKSPPIRARKVADGKN